MLLKKRNTIISLLVAFVLIIGALPIGSWAAAPKKIEIVHTNDIHGRINEDDFEKAAGFAKLQTKLKELRKENPNLLLLDAGDALHGTTAVNLSKGEEMVKLMNDLGYDAMTIGNHDFNFGYDRLLELKEMAKFPIMSANVVKEGKNDFEPYIIKDIEGVKVGIFALTTEESKTKTHPNNIKGVEFVSPIKTAEKYVKELKAKDADIIIALGHLGVEGTTTETSENVLEKVDGIDLFIDGHSHEETNKVVNDAVLVQAGSYTKNLGFIEINLDGKKVESIAHKLIPFEELKELEGDKDILAKLDKIKTENEKVLKEVIGKTKVKLDGEREDVRTKETNLGNLVTDAIREVTGADIGFMTGGNIRATIEAGDVTIGDVVTSFPFANTIMVKEFTGDELKASLENGLKKYPETAGEFPQVSGMSFKFNPKAPVGERVLEIKVGDKAIKADGKYTLATNDFLAAGGDGYEIFAKKPVLREGALLSDMVIEYFAKHKEVEPKLEDRIVVEEREVEVDPKAVKIEINGKLLAIAPGYGEPIIKGNRTLVPLRAVSEGLGHEVKWNKENRTVAIDEKILLAIDSKIVKVDGKDVELDVPATIIENRTYVPLRFISETMGYEVKWDAETRTVIIKTVVEEKPAA